MERDGRPEVFVTVTGRAVLAPASGKIGGPRPDAQRLAAVRHPGTPGRRAPSWYREYLCPVTRRPNRTDAIAYGDEALHDIVIGRASA